MARPNDTAPSGVHQRYDDRIDNRDSQIAEHEVWITEEELHSQAKEGKLAVT